MTTGSASRTDAPTDTASATDRLRRYLTDVRALAGEPLSLVGTLRRVERALTALLTRPLELPAACRRLPAPDEGGAYGRHLLHRDPEGRFVIVAMVWPPGFQGAVHDHGTWGVVGVVEGRVRVLDFERDDDGREPGGVILRKTGDAVVGPGAVATVLPPHRDFHSVGNASDEGLAVTLHTYGRDITACQVVDPATGRLETVRPEYTSEQLLER